MGLINGGPGSEFLTGDEDGDPVADTINGNDGDDTLLGKGANDVLNGGSGDDDLEGGEGADVHNGGDGVDKVNIFGPAGATVNLKLGKGFGGFAEGDTYISIENAQLTIGADTFIGNEAGNLVFGFNADDTLRGFGGDDELLGGLDNDLLQGGNGNDRLSGEEGDDTLKGDNGDDFLDGGAGADSIDGGKGADLVSYFGAAAAVTVDLATGVGARGAAGDRYARIEYAYGSNGFDDRITGDDGDNILAGFGGNDTVDGGAGDDNLQGGDGNDRLSGGDGTDLIFGQAGADTLNGGKGIDLVSYATSALGVTVSLATGKGKGGEAEGDKLAAVENLIGTAVKDRLTGDDLANRLDGGAGDDALQGGIGDDTLIGGAGEDTLAGGDGLDVADYGRSADGIDVSLATGKGRAGDSDGDKLSQIERVVGSAFNDRIAGDAKANSLDGGAGDDVMDGAGGKDILVGAAGADRLTGGAAADVFLYTIVSDSAPGGRDTITDFLQKEKDLIDLSLFEGASGPGDQELIFLGNAAFNGVEGELRFGTKGNQTLVQVDANGDSKADFELVLLQKIVLVADDFLL